MCRALLKHALAEATDDEVSELLKLRSSRGLQDIVGSVLENEAALAHAQEAMVEGDRAEYKKAVDHQRVARGVKPRAPEDGEKADSAVGSANAASSSGGAAPREKALPKPCGDAHPEVEWARTLLPDVRGCALHRDDLWHGRWKANYPVRTPPYSMSRSWGKGKTSVEALREVLTWVWAAHAEHSQEQCPFRLDALPDIVPT